MWTSALVGAIIVLGLATPADAQRRDDLTVAIRNEPSKSGVDGTLLVQRTLWGAFGGAAIGLPLAYFALPPDNGNGALWMAGGAYLLTTAMVVATHRGPKTRCSADKHLTRALLGSIAGAAVAAAIASTMDDTNRAGIRAVIAGTGVFFAPALGAALGVAHCDAATSETTR